MPTSFDLSPRIVARQSGVTVLMIAVALLLVASAVIFATFATSQKSNLERAIQTRGSSSSVDQALTNFVATNMRLPCPASPTDPNGLEASTTPFATCTVPDGVLPWGSLGLKFDDGFDQWGNKLSYRVFSGTTGFTQLDGLKAQDCNTAALLTTTQVAIDSSGKCSTGPNSTRGPDFFTGKGLIVNDKGNATTGIAYAIISHGATGRGAYGADHTANRKTLPASGGKELINTSAPADKTFWILEPSSAGSDPSAATFFDDVVSYRTVTDLLTAANGLPRDWGWVTLSQAFSPTTFVPNANPAQTTTLTVTLTNSATTAATLQRSITHNFPTNLVVATSPAATTTCGGAPVFSATANATSMTFPAGKTIPAATVTSGVKTNGTCTFSVNVTSVATTTTSTNFANTIGAGSSACPVSPLSAVGYLCTDAGWNITSTTANVTATLNGPILTSVSPTVFAGSAATQSVTLNGSQFVTGATVRFTNLSTSAVTDVAGSFVTSLQLTASIAFGTSTASWSIVVINPDGQQSGSQTVTVYSPSQSLNAAAATAAGISLAGGGTGCTATTSVVLDGLTVAASAAYGSAYPSFSTDGIGVAPFGCTAGSSLSSAAGNTEALRFTNGASGFRYLGLKMASFSSNGGSTNDDELAVVTFYDNAGAALSPTITIRACNSSTAASATSNFYLDAGQAFKGFSVAPVNRADGNSSTLRVGSVQFCTTGPASSCTPPSPSATNCP